MNYINEIKELCQRLPRLFVIRYALEVARSVEDLDTTGVAKVCNDTLEGYLRGEKTLDEVRDANATYSAAAASYAAASSSSYAVASYASYAVASYASYASYAASYASAAASAASYASEGRKTKEKEYYELLLLRIKDFTELEKLIWDLEKL